MPPKIDESGSMPRTLPTVALVLSLLCASAWLSLSHVHLADASPMTLLYLGLIRDRSRVVSITLVMAALVLWFGTRLDWWRRAAAWYRRLTNQSRVAVVFLFCFAFVFLFNSQSITSGYFHGDDFEILVANRTKPWRELLFMFNGDHFLPLYRLEVAAITWLFGPSAIAWNLFVYIVVALIPCFSYLLMRRIGFSERTFFIFLVLYAGSVKWGEILSGYYLLSVYVQSSLFALIGLWAYTKWRETARGRFLAIVALAILCGVFVDVAGVWIVPAVLLFMVAYSHQSGDTPKNFIKKNKRALLAFALAVGVVSLYTVYVYGILHHPVKEIPRNVPGTVRDAYFVFSDGIVSFLIAPNVSWILVQPTLSHLFGKAWAAFLFVACLAQVFVWVVTYRKSDASIRAWLLASLGTFLITIAIVVVGRPALSTYLFRPEVHFTCAAYFWYCFSLAVVFEGARRRSPNGVFVRKTVWVLVLVFLTVQLFSSFFNMKLVLDARSRRATFEEIRARLLPTLMQFKGRPTFIPDLPDAENTGRGLATLGLLPQADNLAIVDLDSSTDRQSGEAVSPEFVHALQQSEVLRAYYLKPLDVYQGRRTETKMQNASVGLQMQNGVYVVPVTEGSTGVVLQISADPGHERFTVDLYASNDFGVKDPLAVLHVERSSEIDGVRAHVASVSLEKVYALALSRRMPAEVRFKINDSGAHLVSGYAY